MRTCTREDGRHKLKVYSARAGALRALREAGVTKGERAVLTHCQVLGEELVEEMARGGVLGRHPRKTSNHG